MLYDKNFLNDLVYSKNQIKYARITSLDLNENPRERVSGRITAGSVNVDGTSSVRRTCQLTMITDTIDFNDYLWGLDTKFKLEIGVENNIDSRYQNIIWFNQGIYVITSFSSALSTSGYNISLSGKDKMCQLNGERGGLLPMEVNFGVFEEVLENGDIVVTDYLLKEIIKEAVHHYGNEFFHNIIINDLDNRGKQLQEYKLDVPLYLIRKSGSERYYIQGTLNGQQKVWVDGKETTIDKINYDVLSSLVSTTNGTEFTFGESGESYCAARIRFGQTLGYTPTEMTYAGELIGKPGESVTSVLDKIVQMLGNFEYFYDLDGRFIFQEKQNYVNVAFSPVKTGENGEVVIDPSIERTQFDFINNELFSAFNNTPALNNLYNDYAIWGVRKSVTGKEIPIHLRYAIDVKPLAYKSIEVPLDVAQRYNEKAEKGQESKLYISSLLQGVIILDDHTIINLTNSTPSLVELIGAPQGTVAKGSEDGMGIVIQMDSSKFSVSGNTLTFNQFKEAGVYDWREVLYQMAVDYRKWNHLDDFELRVAQANPDLYSTGKTGYEQYYIDVEGFWRQLYNPNPAEKDKEKFYQEGVYWHWSKDILESPELLNFWIDFLDEGGELSQFSIKNIGIRPKVDNNKDVRAIAYLDTPEVIYKTGIDDNAEDRNNGQVVLQAGPQYSTMFSPSAQGKSAMDRISELLYNHSYCIESVSITSIPIYFLEPNKRIYIQDATSGINGDYLLTKFTVPLAYNGTMNLTATKVVDRII